MNCIPDLIKNLGLFLLCTGIVLFVSCKKSSQEVSEGIPTPISASIKLQSLPGAETGIDFINNIKEEGRINIFTWHFLYNGGGVAAGDINNDGLPDLYFSGNMVPDKLYINKGNFKFEDITANAGISSQIWSSGVTMADVNADGLLDIYVCKNSPTGMPDNNRNKLYINQGKNLFREQAAQYGIDDIGFGVQSTFFDADQDGDLDMYLVNQPFDEFARLVNKPEVVAQYPQTDRFFFFENGKFVDKTVALGLQNARYGLNVAIADFDLNGWTDLYICNDYHHADHLYMNTAGKFTDALQLRTGHLSFYSMGADVGDVNNDGWPDIFSLDMAFEEHQKSKTNMGSMDPDRFWSYVNDGQHYQFMQNGLQVNVGHGYFSEMAQVAGISKSDWSYSALFADLDLDADQDILITNGILRDLQNNDFNAMVKERYQSMVGPDNYLEILKNLPSNPVPNIIFSNDGQMQFTKEGPEAGFDTPGFSHGMVYTDLDGDGKLDVVINNMNAPASIYKNISSTDGHYLQVKLKGPGTNLQGLGCSMMVYAGGKKQIHTMQTSRGYFSSVEPMIHIGLGGVKTIDSIKVYWDHKSMSILKNVKVDQILTIDYKKETKVPFAVDPSPGIHFKEEPLASFVHQEKEFNDYAQQVLLPYKLSQNGPHISTGDLNGDKREDFFIGGAAGYAGAVFFQNASGQFDKSNQPALETDKNHEDQESVLFDTDGDGDLDLIVMSGSNEFADNNPLLKARLYINDGKGTLTRASNKIFPDLLVNGQCIEAFDADGDRDFDLFIGGRLVGGKYAVPAGSKLLINESGSFTDQTKALAPFADKLGMVTDAVSDDVDKDGDMDLVVVGEWMKPTILLNDGKGKMTLKEIESPGAGLWWTIEKGDFDRDGDTDFILGNLGWNNKFGGSRGTKLEVFSNDFDNNGDFDVVLASTKKDVLVPVRGRECSSQEVPYVLDKFPTYESFANAKLNDIYPDETLEASVHKKLSTMSSVYIQNNGDGTFTSTDLPLLCQAGPVKAFYVDDINGDQIVDFIYAGNHLPTEVETARYDGLYSGVCIGDGKGNFTCNTAFVDGELRVEDGRDIQKINLEGGKSVYLFGNNNQAMRMYSTTQPTNK
jgi:hypothetical protein